MTTTDTSELRMNVAALKRVDPYVKDILETATHVALYTFNAENNEWERTDVEGALFVYSRTGEPYNSVLIMNRLNTNNLVEPVTHGLDLQLQEPFLLYRNSRCNIYGIWFYDKDECVRIAAMLNKLIKDSEETRKIVNKTITKGKASAGPSVNNIDIFSMLSKAQEDFNTNKGSNSGGGPGTGGGGGSSSSNPTGNTVEPQSPMNNCNLENIGPLTAPLGPDVTSQSVMDFFAKAKVNTGHFKAGDQPTTGSVVVNESKPLLARLMSHPAAHTLEHIEKQQRSITPQPSQPQPQSQTQPPQPQPPPTLPSAVLTPNAVGGHPSRSKRRNNKAQDSVQSASVAITQDLHQSLNQSLNDTNGSTGFLRIQSPTGTPSTNLTNHQSTMIGLPTSSSNPLASLFAHVNASANSDDIISASTLPTTGAPPALIPPVMFAAPSPAEPLSRPLEPLTRNQLLQAFEYLLRSDPDFMNKLHEAYVKSFGEILS